MQDTGCRIVRESLLIPYPASRIQDPASRIGSVLRNIRYEGVHKNRDQLSAALDLLQNEGAFSNEVSAVPASSFGAYATDDNTVLLMHFNETSGSFVEPLHPNQSEFLAELGVGEPPGA